MTFTKDHLIDAIAKDSGFQKKRTIEIVENLLELSKSSLASGEDALISSCSFGKFCVEEKRKRKGRNATSGESLMPAARRVVTFKCSGRLRAKINGQ
jgi:integration host factor subunit alpha